MGRRWEISTQFDQKTAPTSPGFSHYIFEDRLKAIDRSSSEDVYKIEVESASRDSIKHDHFAFLILLWGRNNSHEQATEFMEKALLCRKVNESKCGTESAARSGTLYEIDQVIFNKYPLGESFVALHQISALKAILLSSHRARLPRMHRWDWLELI